MTTILITGATGNVGRAIVAAAKLTDATLYAGVRNPSKIASDPLYEKTIPVSFDFEKFNPQELPVSLDVVFLMRPPQIADPEVFAQCIEYFKARGTHILFLSIQDADKKEFTPHRKIEHLIIDSGVQYTFIRPGYFMDNLTTTLGDEIQNNRRIYMPSGNLTFSWVDVADVGELIMAVAMNRNRYIHTCIEVTGSEILNFKEVVQIINDTLHTDISYISPSVAVFVVNSLTKKIKFTYILVLLLLHWIPRFGKPPVLSNAFENITGRKPKMIKDFVLAKESFFRRG